MEEKEMFEEILKLKNKIEHKAKVDFGNEYLKLTGLKIGNIIDCTFHYSYGTNKSSYGASKVCKGEIKQCISGLIYVESIDKLVQSYSTSNNRSGRDRRSWWVFEPKITKAELTDIKLTQISTQQNK